MARALPRRGHKAVQARSCQLREDAAVPTQTFKLAMAIEFRAHPAIIQHPRRDLPMTTANRLVVGGEPGGLQRTQGYGSDPLFRSSLTVALGGILRSALIHHRQRQIAIAGFQCDYRTAQHREGIERSPGSAAVVTRYSTIQGQHRQRVLHATLLSLMMVEEWVVGGACRWRVGPREFPVQWHVAVVEDDDLSTASLPAARGCSIYQERALSS